MAYTDPDTVNPGDSLTAALWNRNVRDNIVAMAQTRVVAVAFGDASGGVLETGVAGFLEVPFDCTIVGWTILAAQSGSIVVDIWRDTYANYPPDVADTIAGSEKPTLASAQKNQDLSLSTWDVDVDAGDILGFNIDSVASIKQFSLILRVELREV